MRSYDDISDAEFADAVRYIEGATDDAAEEAYYDVEPIALANVSDGLRILERLAGAVREGSLGSLGAGILENFLCTRAGDAAELVAGTILSNRRLRAALRVVYSTSIPSDVASRLSPFLT